MNFAAKLFMSGTVQSNLLGVLKTMRVRQWSKNIFVFPALVFDGKLFEAAHFGNALLTALCFCIAASSVYLLNDLVDIEKDRQHPRKRLRPLASGQLNPRLAMVTSGVFALISVAAVAWIQPLAGVVIAVYLLTNVLYSFYLKNIAILDVMMIALFFLLRVVAGVVVVHVARFSAWLYVLMAVLALLIGFGKRRHELTLLAGDAASHRSSLDGYNLPLLDHILSIVATIILVSYTFYSFEAETVVAENDRMLVTVPLVFYGVMRYLYLIHVEGKGGAPDELLVEDKHLLVTVLLWVLLVVGVIYFWV